MEILKDIKRLYKSGDGLFKLLFINVIVFVSIAAVKSILFMMGIDNSTIITYLSLPASFGTLVVRPWTLVTYMFTHQEPMHLIMNMLWLYWFGKIFLQFLDFKKLLNLYIVGGVAGGLLFMAIFNISPRLVNELNMAYLYGASSSVVAIVIGAATFTPNYKIRLMFIGDVKIKYIAIASLIAYTSGLTGKNIGGGLSHIGGAVWGYIFITELKKGKHITKSLDNLIDLISGLFTKRSKLKVKYRHPRGFRNRESEEREYNNRYSSKEISAIISKISESGYESLTEDEKRAIFDSNNNR